MTPLLKEISVTNIRGFQELNLEFGTDKPRMLTCMIGRNGTNKTTLLRMIALGFCSTSGASILLRDMNQTLLREGMSEGHLRLKLWPGPGYNQYDYRVLGQGLEVNGTEARLEEGVKFAAAYGVGRGEPTAVQRDNWSSHDPLESLFRDHHPLLGPELALRRINDFCGKSGFEQLLIRIKEAVGLTREDEFLLPIGGGISIKGKTTSGKTIPLNALADGYRRTLHWILDLYSWAIRAKAVDEESAQIEGVLLIDEVEQHLHPSMQAAVLGRLRQLCPKMQLIVTTHSPLVALGCSPGELVVLKQVEDHIVARTSLPDFRSYSIEDMLTDADLFDTEAYSPEYSRMLKEYHQLVIIPREKRAEDQTQRLIFLARNLRQ